ncbi:MAG: hypothetical protein P4M12_09405 [Gammaproteobacteria bacterium]|nr:hypothetical protein [Gammaproteobacteria bacterium]
MFLRNRKLPKVQIEKPKDKKITVSPTLFQQSLVPVLHDFVSFIPDEVPILAQVNRHMHHFMSNGIVWRNLYQTQFGTLYFQVDYKNQYIAEHHFQEASRKGLSCKHNFQKLHEHLAALPFHPWMNFYFAYLAKHGYLVGKSPTEYGLTALKERNLRAAVFLLHYFQNELYFTIGIPDDDLKQLTDDLISFPDTLQTREMICHAYSLSYRNAHSKPDETKATLKNQTLSAFINAIDPNSSKTSSFLDFFTVIFQNLQLINDAFIQIIHANSRKINLSSSVAEVIGLHLMSNSHANLQLTTLFQNMINHFLALNNGAISYHYAEFLYNKLFQLSINSSNQFRNLNNYPESINQFNNAKLHYIQAWERKELRAIEGIFKLFTLQRGTKMEFISIDEYESLLKMGVQLNHNDSLYALANLYCEQNNWYKDVFKIWIVQLCAVAHNAKLKKMTSHAFQPHSNPFLQCALTLIYALRGDKLKSENKFELVISRDSSLFQKYIAFGLQFKLCTSEHVEIISELESSFDAKNAMDYRLTR